MGIPEMGSWNAFTILGVAGAEVPICRLLSQLIQSTDVQPEPMLRALLGRPVAEGASISSVTTEQGFSGNRSRRRADLIVDWFDAKGVPRRLVLEVKLYAHEGEDQTLDYLRCDWSKVGTSAAHACSNCEIDFVYLTLFGDKAKASEFRAVSFVDLAGALSGYSHLPDSRGFLARDLHELFSEAATRGLWDDSTPLHGGLVRAVGSLDMRYQIFRRFCELLAEQSDLDLHGTYRGGGQGRSWFGAHLTRPNWFNHASWSSEVFDPQRDWWVAFQPRLNFPTNGSEPRLDVGLYLETAPYRSQDKVRSLPGGPVLFEQYSAVREERIARIGSCLSERWRPQGRWNQAFALTEIDQTVPMSALLEQTANELKLAASQIDRVI